MIYSDSRYRFGNFFKAYNANSNAHHRTVMRNFPTLTSGFFYYYWSEGDRLDSLAYQFLGHPEFWWKIMDFNPEIIDPFNIEVGTPLRMPNG